VAKAARTILSKGGTRACLGVPSLVKTTTVLQGVGLSWKAEDLFLRGRSISDNIREPPAGMIRRWARGSDTPVTAEDPLFGRRPDIADMRVGQYLAGSPPTKRPPIIQFLRRIRGARSTGTGGLRPRSIRIGEDMVNVSPFRLRPVGFFFYFFVGGWCELRARAARSRTPERTGSTEGWPMSAGALRWAGFFHGAFRRPSTVPGRSDI